MKVRIRGPQTLLGKVSAPRSKALTHRVLVASFLAPGRTTIRKPLRCDDTDRTLLGIKEMGAEIVWRGDELTVTSKESPRVDPSFIDCGESGATFRFLTAVSSGLPRTTRLRAGKGLSERPILPLVEAIRQLGASVELQRSDSGLELQVRGPLKGGCAFLPGETSSQFVSGLLLAAPLATSDVTLDVKGRVESRPYVNMTLGVLKSHGISVVATENVFQISAPHEYRPASHSVPADFSSIAYLLTAGALAGDHITILDVDGPTDLEPDHVIVNFLSEVGASVRTMNGEITVEGSSVQGFDFDATDHPDLVPPLVVLACKASGNSVIRGVRRLQFKETDRLKTVPLELGKMGAAIRAGENEITVEGQTRLKGRTVSSHGDHRVGMACGVASLVADGKSVIEGAEAVSKSYPGFFGDLEKLGVELDVE